jgi:hypothetical protein
MKNRHDMKFGMSLKKILNLTTVAAHSSLFQIPLAFLSVELAQDTFMTIGLLSSKLLTTC